MGSTIGYCYSPMKEAGADFKALMGKRKFKRLRVCECDFAFALHLLEKLNMLNVNFAVKCVCT